MILLGSKQALDATAKQQRYTMRWKLKAYLMVLRQREFIKTRFDEWEAKGFSTGDFAPFFRNGACFGDETPFWNTGLFTAYPPEWPREEVSKGLCNSLRVFHEDRATGDARMSNARSDHCAR